LGGNICSGFSVTKHEKADLPHQKINTIKIIKKLDFKKFVAENILSLNVQSVTTIGEFSFL